MRKTIIMMRGLPGSGKTTMAKTFGGLRLSTDDYWTLGGKSYQFVVALAPYAHKWNLARCHIAMVDQIPLIVIDNTNINRDQMLPYIELATIYDYRVIYAKPDTPWAMDPVECAKRSSHNVPEEKVKLMAESWEDGWDDTKQFLFIGENQ